MLHYLCRRVWRRPLKSARSRPQKLKVVRLYTRLYRARRGLVSQPNPRGALNPKRWRTKRAGDVRAAIIFRKDGFRIPSFIDVSSARRARDLVVSFNQLR